VHPSNYRVSGFCESVEIADLAKLGKSRGLPVIDDVGSGCLYDLSRFGLPDEPIVSESLRDGADLVLFSGDKLLGGPQCGIIVGRAGIIAKLRSNPLARALRVDKLTLAALQATLEIHQAGRAFNAIPVLQQLALPSEGVRVRAEKLAQQLQGRLPNGCAVSVESVASAPGGGALPEQTVSSWAIALACARVDQMAKRLRLGDPSVVCRVQDGHVLVDLRTVMPEDDDAVGLCITRASAVSGGA
jgi:L-seryl-tRNA(Ser) seleniumtransferase